MIQIEKPTSLDTADVILDYAEFSGESIADIIYKMANNDESRIREANELKENFYRDSTCYIYDLIGGNASTWSRFAVLNKFIPNIFDKIKELPGKTFIELGGGIGVVCSIVHDYCDKEVTYVDLQSKALEFAKWRFKKHNQNIKIHVIEKEQFTFPEKGYDFVFTDAVWEHLDEEKQIAYASQLGHYVNPNGILFFLVDLGGWQDVNVPMHFRVDIKAVHNALENTGLHCSFGRNTFASIWMRKII